MWETFQSFGGAEVLGLPVSREWFDLTARINQAVQGGVILQYDMPTREVTTTNEFGSIRKFALLPHDPYDPSAYASIPVPVSSGGNESAVSATIDTDYGGIRIIGHQEFVDKIIGALEIFTGGDGGIWDIVNEYDKRGPGGKNQQGDDGGTVFDYVQRRTDIILYDSPRVDLPGVDGDASSSIALAYVAARKVDGVWKGITGFPYHNYIKYLEKRPPIVTADTILYEALRSNVAPRSMAVKELKKSNPAVSYTLEDQAEDQVVRNQIAEAVINKIGEQTGLFTYKSPFDYSPSAVLSVLQSIR